MKDDRQGAIELVGGNESSFPLLTVMALAMLVMGLGLLLDTGQPFVSLWLPAKLFSAIVKTAAVSVP